LIDTGEMRMKIQYKVIEKWAILEEQ
jgi:hypothetical protein